MRFVDRKVLSILYSNSAACLFELKLYESCSILSSIAVSMDQLYSKAYYRKIKSLLELGRFEEITPYILKIHSMINAEEWDTLHQRYTNYMAQKEGYFKWLSLASGDWVQG